MQEQLLAARRGGPSSATPSSSKTSPLKVSLALGVFATLGGGAWVTWHKSAQTSNELSDLRAELVKVRTEKRESRARAALEPVATAMPVATTTTASMTAPIATAAATGEPPEELTPEEKEHRQGVVSEARQMTLERTHGAESPDPEWAPTARQRLLDAFAAEELKGVTANVDCRATMCRVDVDFANGPGGPDGARSIGRIRPWATHAFTRISLLTKSGSVYLSREGFDLPETDPALIQF